MENPQKNFSSDSTVTEVSKLIQLDRLCHVENKYMRMSTWKTAKMRKFLIVQVIIPHVYPTARRHRSEAYWSPPSPISLPNPLILSLSLLSPSLSIFLSFSLSVSLYLFILDIYWLKIGDGGYLAFEIRKKE